MGGCKQIHNHNFCNCLVFFVPVFQLLLKMSSNFVFAVTPNCDIVLSVTVWTRRFLSQFFYAEGLVCVFFRLLVVVLPFVPDLLCPVWRNYVSDLLFSVKLLAAFLSISISQFFCFAFCAACKIVKGICWNHCVYMSICLGFVRTLTSKSHNLL